jgi:MFS family permease
VTDAFPREQLGLAMGTNTMVAAVGLVIGPVLGGLLVEFNWSWVFWFNVPAAALGALWAWLILRELAKPDSVRGFDPLGVVTFVVGPVTVRTPASSANLGPGFDVLAAAVEIELELEVEETGEYSFDPGGLDVPTGRENLLVSSFERLHSADGISFRQRSEIPLARGLGSSAAAMVMPLKPTTGLSSEPVDRAAGKAPSAAALGAATSSVAMAIGSQPSCRALCFVSGIVVPLVAIPITRALGRIRPLLSIAYTQTNDFSVLEVDAPVGHVDHSLVVR